MNKPLQVCVFVLVVASASFAQNGVHCRPGYAYDSATHGCIPADFTQNSPSTPEPQACGEGYTRQPLTQQCMKITDCVNGNGYDYEPRTGCLSLAHPSHDALGDYVDEVRVKLVSAPGQYTMPDFEIMVPAFEVAPNQQVNAFAVGGRRIIINRTLVQAFYGSPGELAFIMAHEIGHLQDRDCLQRAARMPPAAAQRYCESSADEIGMQYLMAAGFNPWDAGGAMGRLMMSAPQGNSITALIIGRFKSDHPVSIDRINQLGEAARRVCASRPDICRAIEQGQ